MSGGHELYGGEVSKEEDRNGGVGGVESPAGSRGRLGDEAIWGKDLKELREQPAAIWRNCIPGWGAQQVQRPRGRSAHLGCGDQQRGCCSWSRVCEGRGGRVGVTEADDGPPKMAMS